MELGVKVVIPSDHSRTERGQRRNPLGVRVSGNEGGHECGHLTEPLPVLLSDSILCLIQLFPILVQYILSSITKVVQEKTSPNKSVVTESMELFTDL